MPEDLFLFNISHLDERSVEVSWRMVHEVVVGYRATLLLADGTIVSEVSVNETRAFFEELKAFTAYILEVEALVSSPLKLPLVSNISFRTGMYVRTHVHAGMQPTLFICTLTHSMLYTYVCMHVCTMICCMPLLAELETY